MIYASRKELESVSQKVVVSILSKGRQSKVIYPLPPLTEQQSIANYLDDKTTKIDQAISLKKNQIELLKEKRNYKKAQKQLDKWIEYVEKKSDGILTPEEKQMFIQMIGDLKALLV